jgi:8-oxo-dGTP pyrophosphatase MutT (NUDIX family)
MIRVVAAVIEKENRYLVCKRPADKRHGGLWEFPGGKVCDGESDLDALRRELSGELNVLVIAADSGLFKVPDPGSDFLIVFRAVTIFGKPQALEHSALRWASARELISLRMAPGDEVFVREYLLRT